MDSNNFEKLIMQARKFDEDLENLVETWKRPDVTIGRFGECTKETNAHIADLWSKIETVQEGVIQTSLKTDKFSEDMSIQHVLQETTTEYEKLKEQCDNIELILEKYGYHYDKETSTDQNITNNTETSDMGSPTEIREIEFTPNLSWKQKVKEKKHLTSTFNESDISHLVTTPVTKNSTSLLKDISILQIDNLYTPIKHTPSRLHPLQPFYSKHFYDSLKH